MVILEYVNGTRATFHTNLNAAIRERRMYMLGEFGAVRADFVSSKVEVQKIGFDEELRDIFDKQMDAGGHGGADTILTEHFQDLMPNDNVKPLSTLDNGIEAAITCFAIEEARKNNKIVDVDSYRF